jgi:ATP-dependent Clp protease ATP-binding subunit ClpB
VVVFEPLGREQIAGITEIQLGRLRSRLLERELSLSLSPEALDKLIAVGYDPVYGARPLKRAIQRWIENPLAQLILAASSCRVRRSPPRWKATKSSLADLHHEPPFAGFFLLLQAPLGAGRVCPRRSRHSPANRAFRPLDNLLKFLKFLLASKSAPNIRRVVRH